MKRKGFSVISSQRSGSTMLIHILDQHPEIVCAGEIFKEQTVKNILHPEFSFDMPLRKENMRFKLAPNWMIKKHLKNAAASQNGLFGFKLMISQMDKCPAIERVLNQSGFLKIILIRENIVEQSLSLELAKSKNKWINDDSALEVPSKVSINIQSFSKTIQFFERCRAKLLEIGSDPNALIINYESLSKNQNACLKKVTDYLGVGPEFSYELKLKPSSDLGYEDRISNFDEVKNYLELNHPLRSDV